MCGLPRAECGTDRYLVVANVRERLSVNKVQHENLLLIIQSQ